MTNKLKTKRLRGRDLGLKLPGITGAFNAITDVPGITVGFTTLIEDAPNGAAIRTGVTAILPRPKPDLLNPLWAGYFSMNGNGELTGCHWIDEAGCFTGPIAITNSCSVGIVHHGIVRWLARQFPQQIGETVWPLPVVGETFDGWLNDIAGQHVTEQHVLDAIETASSGFVPEGNVGGGTGMIAYEFKAGTGTSSRRFQTRMGNYTLGVLVQANHGLRPWLKICGVNVGELIPEHRIWSQERGSIIVILGTDAPLLPTQLRRIAKRIAIGMGRGGTPSGNNSGDIYMAFSTANNQGPVPEPTTLHFNAISNDDLDAAFMATVEAVDEAILNALLGAETITGKHGHIVHAIDPEKLRQLILKKCQ